MKPHKLEKDESIHRLLARLEASLGKDAFHVVDHWEADLSAIGIARPDNHGVLVYIAMFGQEEDSYFVSLELPTTAGGETWKDHPYTPAGEKQLHGLDNLLNVIRRHFAWRSEPVSAK